MHYFLYILLNNIVPIFILIFLGYAMEKNFALDIRSFSKVNFYIFLPALIFVKIYKTDINFDLLKAILFGVLILILLYILAILTSRIRGYKKSTANAFKNSIMFYNSGNFGLPLITLVFKDSSLAAYAVSIQVMILMVQNFTTNTIAFYNAGRGQMNFKETVKKILRMPVVYVVILAIILKTVPYDLTQMFLWPAIEYMKDGFFPVVLLTLGIQLSIAELNLKNIDVYLASLIRLIGGPILAYLLIQLMGIGGIMAQVLFISSSVPSSVTTALIAVEFDNEPDFASQLVLTTTILSVFTLTGVIYLSQILF